MKHTLIFIFTISIFFFQNPPAYAQQQVLDTVDGREKYGLRVGLDLSKPLRTVFDENYSGLEIMGDYRIYEKWFVAGEMGFDEFNYDEPNFEGSTNGSYIKLGANYNAYNNWAGMQNEIYAGARYGFAAFSQNLDQYSIYTTSPYFPTDVRDSSAEFNQLTASWMELMLGIKVEVLNNLYLGLQVQLKRRITETKPGNFDNMYIPGFHRTYDGSSVGVGYGYSISYMIPLYKK